VREESKFRKVAGIFLFFPEDENPKSLSKTVVSGGKNIVVPLLGLFALLSEYSVLYTP
jgi:hypothetical protein